MYFGLKKFLFLIVVVVVAICIKCKQCFDVPTAVLDENQYWGPGDRPEREDESIRSFKINISEELIIDLKSRLHNTRPLHLPLKDVYHQYGINAELVEDVLDFWKVKYHWKKKREPYFNNLHHYKTTVQGLNLHYIRERPDDKIVEENHLKVLPIVLLHGWPGSFREYTDIIPFLTRPKAGKDFVFEVVVPSLPGYGFSDGASKPGLGAIQTAVLLNNLMKRIGFDEYYVHGGDWGSFIGSVMSSMYPEAVKGFHSNMCFTMTPVPNLKMILGSLWPSWIVEEKYENRIYPLSKMYARLLEESGYLHLQATKPDTIGVALSDSPIGLAAYILDRFVAFSNSQYHNTKSANLRNGFGYENLLDNIMIYWLTGSITSSMRLYAETFNPSQFALGWLNQPIKVPTGCTRFKYEVSFQPESILKHKYLNLVFLNDYEVGGHFATLELPAVLQDDIWAAVEAMRK